MLTLLCTMFREKTQSLQFELFMCRFRGGAMFLQLHCCNYNCTVPFQHSLYSVHIIFSTGWWLLLLVLCMGDQDERHIELIIPLPVCLGKQATKKAIHLFCVLHASSTSCDRRRSTHTVYHYHLGGAADSC